MDAKTTVREQMNALHGILEAAIADCPADALTKKLPNAKINTIGAIYAHTVFSEDGMLNGMIRGQAPVYIAGGWAEKIGVDMPRGTMEPDWTVDIDIDLFRQYAAKVYEATDKYLDTVTDEELGRIIEPGFTPPMPVLSFISTVLAWHVGTHQGEISALKGVQGLEGLVLTH